MSLPAGIRSNSNNKVSPNSCLTQRFNDVDPSEQAVALLSSDELENSILQVLGRGDPCKTPTDLFAAVRCQHPNAPFKTLRYALRSLLNRGVITYSHNNAASQLQFNYKTAFKISKRLLLWPFETKPDLSFGGAILHLGLGAAFGDGNHPTTRLSLKGLDSVVQSIDNPLVLSEMAALDIGTGSGVLAIAAVLLGVGAALGLDTDSVACHEAARNVIRNGLEAKVQISNEPLECYSNRTFGLVLANLRPPTLRNLFPLMRSITAPQGRWILSGFRPAEKASLLNLLHQSDGLIWEAEEQNWAAFAVTVGFGG